MTLMNASSNFQCNSFWFGSVYIRAKDFSNMPSHLLDVNTRCLPLQAMRLIHKTRKKLIDNLHFVNWFFSERSLFGLDPGKVTTQDQYAWPGPT